MTCLMATATILKKIIRSSVKTSDSFQIILFKPILFLYTLKRIAYLIVHLTLSLITTGGMLIISLFWLPH